MRRPPDRWSNVEPFGTVWRHCFLPMKTPLSCLRYKDTHNHTPRGVTEAVTRQFRSTLVAVIDLTAKRDGYYSREEFMSVGVRVFRFPIVGHSVPSHDTIEAFIRIADTALAYASRVTTDADHAVVGVHCTHGENRTGFLLAAYFMRREGLSAPAALEEFQYHRPPGMQRPLLREALLDMK